MSGPLGRSLQGTSKHSQQANYAEIEDDAWSASERSWWSSESRSSGDWKSDPGVGIWTCIAPA